MKIRLVMLTACLGILLVSCSPGAGNPTRVDTPTFTPSPILASLTSLPTDTPSPTLEPTVTQPPSLAGFWQVGEVVFTIEQQADQYSVTGINATGTSQRSLTDQSWDGNSLTWTYKQSDQFGSWSVTYKTTGLTNDRLIADTSTSDGYSEVKFLRRVNSAVPLYYELPYEDDFSDPSSGWSIFSAKLDAAGYKDGNYFVVSKSSAFSSYGEANRLFGDTRIAVDATPYGGPSDNNFSYHIGCRIQSNADGYLFEVRADGYYSVNYYKNGKRILLVQGGQWQKSDAILPGMTTNHLVATCAGDELTARSKRKVAFRWARHQLHRGRYRPGCGNL